MRFYATAFGAKELFATPLLLLELDDPDEAARRAIAAGATEEMPVEEMFWGERYGVVRDPFGHRWALSTARQEYTPDDIASHTPPEAAFESDV